MGTVTIIYNFTCDAVAFSAGCASVTFVAFSTGCASVTFIAFSAGCASSAVFTIFTVFTVFNDGSSDWAIT